MAVNPNKYMDKYTEYLTFGYGRSSNIPKDVMYIIIEYYFTIKAKQLAYKMDDQFDSWNKDTLHTDYVIDTDDTTILYRHTWGRDSVPNTFGNQIISGGITFWRFKLINHDWFVGIINANKRKQQEYSFYDRISDSYCIWGYNGNMYHLKGNQKTWKEFKFKPGDILCMYLNYDTKKLSYSLNDAEFICVCNIDTSLSYALGIGCDGTDHKIKLEASIHIDQIQYISN
eukprot:335257_1